MIREVRMAAIEASSIAALLGVRPKTQAFTSLDLAKEVGRGLSVDAVDRLCREVAPAMPGLRYRIVSKATLARRHKTAKRRLSRDEGDRLARLARLWAFALEVWGSAPAARRFLSEPYPLLSGRVPLEVATETEIGARIVEELLGRLKYGSAA
jgi:putative toxin-antitoxin system antitoxin component (TIGR02293 family)